MRSSGLCGQAERDQKAGRGISTYASDDGSSRDGRSRNGHDGGAAGSLPRSRPLITQRPATPPSDDHRAARSDQRRLHFRQSSPGESVASATPLFLERLPSCSPECSAYNSRSPTQTRSGIAMYPNHGADMAGLVRAADEAMYMAKKAGGDRAHVAPEPSEQDPTTT